MNMKMNKIIYMIHHYKSKILLIVINLIFIRKIKMNNNKQKYRQIFNYNKIMDYKYYKRVLY